jgi:hypothetical protein
VGHVEEKCWKKYPNLKKKNKSQNFTRAERVEGYSVELRKLTVAMDTCADVSVIRNDLNSERLTKVPIPRSFY